MPVIALSGGRFCSVDEVSRRCAEALEVPLVKQEVLQRAASKARTSEAKIRRAMSGPPSFFDALTHEREKLLCQLRLAVAEQLRTDSFVCVGHYLHLIPAQISHCLRVCLVADGDYRASVATGAGLNEAEASKLIKTTDAEASSWTHFVHRRGAWDASLYDITIPVHSTSVGGAVDLIVANAAKDALKPSQRSLQAAIDFVLSAKVAAVLLEAGHHSTEVLAQKGEVTVVINRNVLRLDRLSRELERVAGSVSGVSSVATRVGPGFNRPDIVRGVELPTPSRVLLVDDEREFALTLSERLEMRSVSSEVVYDGKQALAYVEQHEPDVMVLDLRMPGMGGMEVLQRIKQDHPRVEVIILTGHGSEQDERRAMEHGAFAYLQKPVDINRLASTMKAAEAKARGGDGEPE